MGCCLNQYEVVLNNPQSFFNDLINKTITSRFYSYGIEKISDFDRYNVDKILLQVGNIQTNALGLSILIGDIRLLKYLHQNFKASFQILEEQLEHQNLSMTEFFILNFNPEVFKYFMPIYLESLNKSNEIHIEDTLHFSTVIIPKPKKNIHPMRYSTEIGNLAFLSFILEIYKSTPPPDCFDIHSIDEDTGENCALISCSEGNLELIIFLHKAGCDFSIKNKNNENAINLALAHIRENQVLLLSVLSYLLENIGLDVTDNFEETLMLTSNQMIAEYLEVRLKNKGVDVTKRIVESKYETSFRFDRTDYEEHMNSLPSIISSIGWVDSSILSKN